MKNNVEVDYSRDSAVPKLHFLFFLLLLTSFSQNLSMLNLETSFSALFMPIYCKKAFRGLAACLGELRLSHEVTGSPRRAGYLTWKSFGGPG